MINMDDRIKSQLASLLETITEEKKDEIVDILQQVAENYFTHYGANALRDSPPEGFLSNERMYDLIEEYNWLFPYRMFLEQDCFLDDEYLFALYEMLENDETLTESLKEMIKPLIESKETFFALQKLESCISDEHVEELCRTYPTLNSLQSTQWMKINNEMKRNSWFEDEIEFVEQLWCRNSPLRQLIVQHPLPLDIIADGLERMKVVDLKDLQESDFEELCRDLTTFEKTVFTNLYQQVTKSSSIVAKAANACDQILEQNLKQRIVGLRNAVEMFFDGDNLMEDARVWNDSTRSLKFNYWSLQSIPVEEKLVRERLKDIGMTLDVVEAFLKAINNSTAWNTDEELVAKVGEGALLHGVSFGINSDGCCKPTPRPLLEAPSYCVVKSTSMEPLTRIEYFEENEEMFAFKNSVSEIGISFALNNKLPYDIGDNTTNKRATIRGQPERRMTAARFQVFPVASFEFENGQDKLKLSLEAIQSLHKVKDVSTAEKFLLQYGSHVHGGLHHLGAILYHSVEVSTLAPKVDKEQLKKKAIEELDSAISMTYRPFKKSTVTTSPSKTKTLRGSIIKRTLSIKGPPLPEWNYRYEFDNIGGPVNVKQPELFQELVENHKYCWHVIDREYMPESLIPIWNIVNKNHSDLGRQAELLCEAWLQLVSKCNEQNGLERIKSDRKSYIEKSVSTTSIHSIDQAQNKVSENKSNKTISSYDTYDSGRIEASLSKQSSSESIVEQKSPAKQSTPSHFDSIRSTKSIQPKSIPEIQETLVATVAKPNKKPYSAFIIDRPFDTAQAKKGLATAHLMNCLRHRLSLEQVVERDSTGSTGDENNATPQSTGPDWNSMAFGNEKTCSLHDTMLRLVDEFDASGIAEIFRLLLERRSAIPLFVSSTRKDYSALLRHVALPGDIRLGEDKSLIRLVVVSCRHPAESRTSDILKSLFHINSLHGFGQEKGSVTSESVSVEIGFGCVVTDAPSSDDGASKLQVIVTHVVGDFKRLWPFISKFADYVFVEDATEVENGFYHRCMVRDDSAGTSSVIAKDLTTKSAKPDKGKGCVPFVILWKPSFAATVCQEVTDHGFRHLFIECEPGSKIVVALKPIIVKAIKETEEKYIKVKDTLTGRKKKRKSLCELVSIANEAGFDAPIQCPAPADIESRVDRSISKTLGHVKRNEFLLQLNFRDQARHEEAKNKHRLDKAKVQDSEAAIKKCMKQRRENARKVAKHPLLKLLSELLDKDDPSERVLSIRALESTLTNRGERELAPLKAKIDAFYSAYEQQLSTAVDPRSRDSRAKDESKSGTPDKSKSTSNKDIQQSARDIHLNAKTEYNESVLSMEHVWREFSHVYTASSPQNRTASISNAPRLAAQHLLDGFCIELLDGDSNTLHMEWISEVLRQVGYLTDKHHKYSRGARIFVLSVMGVQSSGKSTLLNTMFGIQMRTSVGQCTRGVNMQLIAVEDRREYDYILLLDTEGTRAPEYHGLHGSVKRDNQMVTLSILLADATIIVIPGENDAAVKEMLPIVLLAYQGSQLAESKGGRLSSMMFFVYNRIDTTQKGKLDSIVQTLGTSLRDAFDQVQKLGGSVTASTSDNPFRSFQLDVSGSSDSDVCVLGNVKEKFEPPGDVPDAAYGEALVRFREHIHRKVMSTKEAATWRSRSITEFSKYIEEVWRCVGSANFTLNFSSILERVAFDALDSEFKRVEQKLADWYRVSFAEIEKEMVKEKRMTSGGDNTTTLKSFEKRLKDKVEQKLKDLDGELDIILKEKGRENWRMQYQKLWGVCKRDQALNWQRNLKTSFNTIFKYEQNLDKCKKEMRKTIAAVFSSDRSTAKWTESQKKKKFKEIYGDLLKKAQGDFPPKSVPEEVLRIYLQSSVILSRQIDIHDKKVNKSCEKLVSEQTAKVKGRSSSKLSDSVFASTVKKALKNIEELFAKKNKSKEDPLQKITDCLKSVWSLVNSAVYGKPCYDDSIISDVIDQTDQKIKDHGVTENYIINLIHIYSRLLVTKLTTDIQEKWEAENSVYAKLKQKDTKQAMLNYLDLVSQGVQKSRLFTEMVVNTLKSVIKEAFEKEMIQRTSNRIRNERWLHDARFMQKHIDLHLIDLLDANKLHEVLEHLWKPDVVYGVVLRKLIAKTVPNVDEIWKVFANVIERTIRTAFKNAASSANAGSTSKAQRLVDELKKEFLDSSLNPGSSVCLGNAFSVDYSGEYDNYDDEETFQQELIKVLDDSHRMMIQQDYAVDLSSKVVRFLITLNDSAFLPRCESCCEACKSMCFEAINHDPEFRPHDTVHQPRGIVGVCYDDDKTLVATTCSQSYEMDECFTLGDVEYSYRKDFARAFPGWKEPRINEELRLREYILATYNEDIAKKYGVKACVDLPVDYNRELSTIREHLLRETS